MDHQRAFLQAIRDEPDEDAHRLVYADWLEEHAGRDGAARAAFIRAQCRLARLPEDDPARLGLEDEVSELLVEHEEEWTAPVRGVVEDYRFERGFIDRVTLWSDVFLTHAAGVLFAALPLRAIRLGLGPGPSAITEAKALAACPYLASLEELDLRRCYLTDRGLRELLESPHLGRLTVLNLAS